jgi:hypothetical protein
MLSEEWRQHDDDASCVIDDDVYVASSVIFVAVCKENTTAQTTPRHCQYIFNIFDSEVEIQILKFKIIKMA